MLRNNRSLNAAVPHLNQLHEVLKVLLLVNGELAVVIDDAVVLHLAIAADAQCVIAGIVGALPHQEQARLRRVEEPLGLLPSYLPMKPATRREDRQKKKDKRKRGGKGEWRHGVEKKVKEGKKKRKKREKTWSEYCLTFKNLPILFSQTHTHTCMPMLHSWTNKSQV